MLSTDPRTGLRNLVLGALRLGCWRGMSALESRQIFRVSSQRQRNEAKVPPCLKRVGRDAVRPASMCICFHREPLWISSFSTWKRNCRRKSTSSHAQIVQLRRQKHTQACTSSSCRQVTPDWSLSRVINVELSSPCWPHPTSLSTRNRWRVSVWAVAPRMSGCLV